MPSEAADARQRPGSAEPVMPHAVPQRARDGRSGAGVPAARAVPGSGGTGTVTASPPSPEQSHEQSSEQSQADDQAMARILADASRRTTRVPEGADPLRSLHAIPDPSAPAPPAHTADPAGAAGHGRCGRRRRCEQRRSSTPGRRLVRRAPAVPAPTAADASLARLRHARHGTPLRRRVPRHPCRRRIRPRRVRVRVPVPAGAPAGHAARRHRFPVEPVAPSKRAGPPGPPLRRGGPWKRRAGGSGAPGRHGIGAGGGTGCRRSEGKRSRRGLRKVTGRPECEECRRSVPGSGGL